ncbi:DNA-binding transcriptional repressor AcrR [Candidatus Izimaplasma bacterium HR1]|uniref:TetR family transcriptional regulator n=1 Tax=Candidatus Izimoplasma sp. HR1 TaxID=1541959 RepID=UPI0004F8421F|nr:DNA-binding transcriptional repressor AcrR [Candidatus Izimaplasma bacterium HR1]
MPKKTYINLVKDKKDRIFNAGVLEFSYHEFNDASVNTIVRMANISKGSFYQYFKDKSDFYWHIVMHIIVGHVGEYESLLKKNKGDLFITEEQVFNNMLDLFDDQKYKNLIKNAYRSTYLDIVQKISSRGSVVYINMYDILMSFGFKGYNIKSKDDFIVVFDMLRNITNNTIMTMIIDDLSKAETKKLYIRQLLVLEKGILKRGLF